MVFSAGVELASPVKNGGFLNQYFGKLSQENTYMTITQK